MTFEQWFSAVTGHAAPRGWQSQLSESPACTDRLIRIPTGMGKTEGVLAAWAWHRLVRRDPTWPRRLVWCLPMRVLVEQTRRVMGELLLRSSSANGSDAVRVFALMGGEGRERWHLDPEAPAVLVGTQDMLLSRALNRGYAAGRAHWPTEYGLLNQDCLWVMDEVQLMDVGLATSAQLQAFRREQAGRGNSLRPCHTWWMSATFQPDWLATPESSGWLPDLRETALHIPADERSGGLWEVEKPAEVRVIPAAGDRDCERLAQLALDAHQDAQPVGSGRVTLVIVNRVETAVAAHRALQELLDGRPDAPELRLVHSRFRPLERTEWPDEFLSRSACEVPAVNRIIVATQVVEAGVDISGTALITELAPWSSLVQRFGRAARYGGRAGVTVVDREVTGKNALPYSEEELAASAAALEELSDVGPASLERFEEGLEARDPGRLVRLYPYEPLHLLTRRESDELFDTSPDLSGADVDVSRFIRTGEERDLYVFWVPDAELVEKTPSPEIQPLAEGLCPVPFQRARRWLFQEHRLKPGTAAWVWDYVNGRWQRPSRADCYPGQVLLVSAESGGYELGTGFTGARPRRTDPALPLDGTYTSAATPATAERAQARDDESQQPGWKTIATHGRETGDEAAALAEQIGLAPELVSLLELSGRLHDWGKAHPAFDTSILDTPATPRPRRRDLAKAPRGSWARPGSLYQRDAASGPRPGFRHELATTLGLFALLRSVDAHHDALLGSCRALIDGGVLVPAADDASDAPPHPLGVELATLDGIGFDLLAYLVCAHHGKVRGSWQGTPHDQDFPVNDARYEGEGQPIFGVREGDRLPAIPLVLADGTETVVPAVTLHLDPAALGLSERFGVSWRERVERLLDHYGPFTLAFLEALLRAADVRASRLTTNDPILAGEEVEA